MSAGEFFAMRMNTCFGSRFTSGVDVGGRVAALSLLFLGNAAASV